MTTRHGMNPALLGLALTVGACSSPNASTLTHPPRKASFPMYISIPGITVGQGSIVKIDAERQILYVRGGVPGPQGGNVLVRKTSTVK